MDAHPHGRRRFRQGRFVNHVQWAVLTAVAVLVFAGAATAYPAGDNGPTAGHPRALTLTASFASGIVPGQSEPVTFTAANSGNAPIYVKALHLSAISVDGAHAACVTSDFSMDEVGENQWVPAHTGAETLPNQASLTYANTDRSQDACSGAKLTLTLTRQ